MKNFNAFLILLLTAGQILTAQNSTNEYCSTPEPSEEEMEMLPWYGNNDTLPILRAAAEQAMINMESSSSNFLGSEKTFSCDVDELLFIPVKFWFIKNEESESVPSERTLQVVMDILNDGYQRNGLPFRFYMLCPSFIVDPVATIIDGNEEATTDVTIQPPKLQDRKKS